MFSKPSFGDNLDSRGKKHQKLKASDLPGLHSHAYKTLFSGSQNEGKIDQDNDEVSIDGINKEKSKQMNDNDDDDGDDDDDENTDVAIPTSSIEASKINRKVSSAKMVDNDNIENADDDDNVESTTKKTDRQFESSLNEDDENNDENNEKKENVGTMYAKKKEASPTDNLIKDLNEYDKRRGKETHDFDDTSNDDDENDTTKESSVEEGGEDNQLDEASGDDTFEESEDEDSDIEEPKKRMTYLERITYLKRRMLKKRQRQAKKKTSKNGDAHKRKEIPKKKHKIVKTTPKHHKTTSKHHKTTPKHHKTTKQHKTTKHSKAKKTTKHVKAKKTTRKEIKTYKLKSCVRIKTFARGTEEVKKVKGPKKKHGKIFYKMRACGTKSGKHKAARKCYDIDYKISTGKLSIKKEREKGKKIFSIYGCKNDKGDSSKRNSIPFTKKSTDASGEGESEESESGSGDQILDDFSGSGDDTTESHHKSKAHHDLHHKGKQQKHPTTKSSKHKRETTEKSNKFGDLMKMITDMREEMKKQSKEKINEKELVKRVQKLMKKKKEKEKKKPTSKHGDKEYKHTTTRYNDKYSTTTHKHGKHKDNVHETRYDENDKEDQDDEALYNEKHNKEHDDEARYREDHAKIHGIVRHSENGKDDGDDDKHDVKAKNSDENRDENRDDDRDSNRDHKSERKGRHSKEQESKDHETYDGDEKYDGDDRYEHSYHKHNHQNDKENNLDDGEYNKKDEKYSTRTTRKHSYGDNRGDEDDEVQKKRSKDHHKKIEEKDEEEDGGSAEDGFKRKQRHFSNYIRHRRLRHHDFNDEENNDNFDYNPEKKGPMLDANERDDGNNDDIMKHHDAYMTKNSNDNTNSIENMVAKILPAVMKSVSRQTSENSFKRSGIPTALPTMQPSRHHTTVKRTTIRIHKTTPRHTHIKTTKHVPTHTVQKIRHTTIAANLNMIVKGLKALGISPNSLNQNKQADKRKAPTKSPQSVSPRHFSSPRPHVVNLHNPSKIRILCFGDSLTAGYNAHGKNFYPYCSRLQNVLNYRSNVPVYTDTKGIVGEMTHKQMTHRLPMVLGNSTSEYDWIIILGGTNDILHVKNFADDQEFLNQLETVWQPRITKDIEKLHQTAYKYGAHTVLLTVPENSIEVWPEYKPLLKMRQRINDALRNFAFGSKGKTVLCDLARKLPRHSLGPVQEARLWDDHLHMTPEGYTKMAGIIADCLKPYLPH